MCALDMKKSNRSWLWTLAISLCSVPFLVACGGDSDDGNNGALNGVEVLSERLYQDSLGCRIAVTARNNTSNLKNVLLMYIGSNSSGQPIGTALTQQFLIGPNSTQTTRQDTTGNYFLSLDRRSIIKFCSSISRIQLDTKNSVVAP